LVFRDEALGMMAAFDRDAGSPEFDEDDQHVPVVFAASAATAGGSTDEPSRVVESPHALNGRVSRSWRPLRRAV
jgi:hypothetical protein